MAFKCYEEQLELGQRLKDPSIEAQVYGNMGITKMNMGVMEEAIGYFEQQLAMLQQLSGNEAVLDRGRAYGNLGDCYDSLEILKRQLSIMTSISPWHRASTICRTRRRHTEVLVMDTGKNSRPLLCYLSF